MTGRTVTADAQWALFRAKAADGESRVLACSAGELGPSNFDDLIRRFDPGPLAAADARPRITLSYLVTASAGENLLAMAIHGGRPDDGDAGRESDVTRYFCVPYLPLASAAVTYQEMHRALGALRLPSANGLPRPVTMTAPEGTPGVDDLALQAAALLLTGRPVCVLGAERVPPAARLAFIDSVMSLLPYGLRAKMTAATSTVGGYQDHRFRLYFSAAARVADPPDHTLIWEQPGARSPIDDNARKYLDWLKGEVGQPTAKLAELIEPMRFSDKSVLRMLDSIGVVSQDDPSLNYSATGQDWLHPASVPPAGVAPGAGAPVLRACAEHVRNGDLRAIRSDIGVLMGMDGIDDHERAHYRQIIKETELLQRAEELKLADRLYEQLLRVAFTLPLSYEGYRQVEGCLGGRPLRPTLWQAIEMAGLADPWVTSIVYWSLPKARWRLRESGRQKLNRWYGSGEVNVVDFVDRLGGKWEHPAHARIVCEVALDFLKQQPKGYQADAVRAALKEHGFLAGALQANQVGDAKFRASALRQFLASAYPDGLGQTEVIQILAGRKVTPTPSLLAAVLLLTDPADEPLSRLAWRAYLRGSINAMALDQQTRLFLKPRLPTLNTRPTSGRP